MKKLLGALALAYTAISGTAHAADVMMPMDKWFVHVGVAGVILDDGLISASDPRIIGASVTDSVTPVFEVGRFVTDNFAVAVSAGIPPTSDFSINTVIPSTLKVGTATAGPVMLLGQYHFNRGGQIEPYIGAGLAYQINFSATPNAAAGFTALSVDNSIAPVLQAGFNVPVANHIQVFADVKKLFLTSHATSTHLLLGTGTSDVRLNPWIISAGVGFTF